jgi:hypothetical protein
MKEKGVDVVFQLSPDSVTHIYIYIYIFCCGLQAQSRKQILLLVAPFSAPHHVQVPACSLNDRISIRIKIFSPQFSRSIGVRFFFSKLSLLILHLQNFEFNVVGTR